MRRTVFAQLLDHIPRRDFWRCVERYGGSYNVRKFSCWDQFLSMSFAQLTHRDSLRDIEICLRGMKDKLYRVGLRGQISRSTLADANEKRSSRIYRDFCHMLMQKAQKLFKDERFIADLDALVFVLDSSWIHLCMALCPWAAFGKNQAFIKLHTLLDLRGSIPTFIAISKANVNDFFLLDRIPVTPGAFYIVDKGYFDLRRLQIIKDSCAFFVIRKKVHVKVSRIVSTPVEKETGLRADQVVKFRGSTAKRKYPDRIRLVRFRDTESNILYSFLTNNFHLPALTICKLYKERWNIELFFRWIKQHLRITKFYGTSRNAVETQIYIAVATYLLVAITKKQLCIKTPLYQILHFLSVSLFEETSIYQAFSNLSDTTPPPPLANQLALFTI